MIRMIRLWKAIDLIVFQYVSTTPNVSQATEHQNQWKHSINPHCHTQAIELRLLVSLQNKSLLIKILKHS